MKKKLQMTTKAEEIKAHVERTLSAALHYFVGSKVLSFMEFESELGHFLEAYLKQLPSFQRLSYRFHPSKDGDRFDIGFIFEDFMIASQLFEADRGIKTSTTFH